MSNSFFKHTADTLAKFSPYEGDIERIFSKEYKPSQLLIETKVAPELTSVHDWIDHVFFGRALSLLSDSIAALNLDKSPMQYRQMHDFLKLNNQGFKDWQAQTNTSYPLIKFLDFSKWGNEIFSGVSEGDLITLFGLPDTSSEYSEKYSSVFKELLTSARSENIFVAEYELILSDWVSQSLSSLMQGGAVLKIPRDILDQIALHNSNRTEKLEEYKHLSDQEILNIRNKLSGKKQKLFRLASLVIKKFTGTTELRERFEKEVAEILAL